MAEEVKKLKIIELPEKNTINEFDTYVVTDGLNTYKSKASNLSDYVASEVKESMAETYIARSETGIACGVAPLNTDTKIDGTYITYGETANTAYEGSSGMALEENLESHMSNSNNPHNTTKTQVGLGNVDNTSDMNKPVSTAQQAAIDLAYGNSNAYTDTKINQLINGAPETLDTLKEISDAITDNEEVVEALNEAIGTKASQSELDTHTGNTTVHIVASERENWNAAKTHADTAHAPSDAEKNQKAISSVTVGQTTIEAGSVSDKLTLSAGNNITLTPDVENKSITISSTDTIYEHPTGDGDTHVPKNGTTNGGKYLKATIEPGVTEWGTLTKDDVVTALGYTPGISGTDANTTYTVSNSGSTITLTGSDGSSSSATIEVPDIEVDSVLNSSSANPVQNKVVTTELGNKASLDHTHAEATTTASGFLSSSDKSKLDGLQSALDEKASTSHKHVSSDITDIKDSTSASAISSGANHNVLITERAVYYGLPKINNSHAYNSSTAIYAPTAGGTSGYELVGAGTTSAPVWKAPNYGTCSTAASTAAKVVSLSNFKLVTGASIKVKFTYANSAAAPTLNVNSTGAKPIYYKGAAVLVHSGYVGIKANNIYDFVYDGTNWEIVGELGSDGIVYASSSVELRAGVGSSLNLIYLGSGNASYTGLYPYNSSTATLGNSSFRWGQIYSTNGAISTSDREEKTEINNISESYEKLFMLLQPRAFMFKDGDRIHIGAVSQEVEEAMHSIGITAEEFGGFCKDQKSTPVTDENGELQPEYVYDDDGNPIYTYSLRYQEFIFLTIHMVQKNIKKMEDLESRISKLEALIS